MKILLGNFAKMVNDSGGLAKVTCAFANEMVQRGHQVTLVYSDDKEGEFFFPVAEQVKCYNLRHFRGANHTFPLAYKIKREFLKAIDMRRGRGVNNEFTRKYLAKYVEKILLEVQPDVIVASQPAATEIFISVLNIKVPVITMSHGDPEDYFHTYPIEELAGLPKSAACQVLVPSFAKALASRYPDLRTVVIGNVVPQYTGQVDLAQKKEHHKIIFIGRLVKNHKRPHLLLEAFAKLAADFPNWQVECWGAEDSKKYTAELQQIIKRYNLTDRVFLRGTTQHVDQVLAAGDIFVFPSAYEGFGLTLAEAMSMGLPAIGYRNCPAVNELIVDGVNGYLCADGIADLADKMRLLMSNQFLRCQLGQQARESMRQYAAEIIWPAWENLLQDVIAHH